MLTLLCSLFATAVIDSLWEADKDVSDEEIAHEIADLFCVMLYVRYEDGCWGSYVIL